MPQPGPAPTHAAPTAAAPSQPAVCSGLPTSTSAPSGTLNVASPQTAPSATPPTPPHTTDAVVHEVRCDEGHALGTLHIPAEHFAPDLPRIHVSIRCWRCSVKVESVAVPMLDRTKPSPAALQADGREPIWRRARRQEFEVRCHTGQHLMGRLSIPVQFLERGGRPLRFVSRCRNDQQDVTATFLLTTPPPAPAAAPPRVAAQVSACPA